ncbi:MAG: sulfonate ABC transporter permease [Planctomycetota bacterium]|nr:MAG: sulfonate ABC transporter permease [Planctomycetota bacterium]
MTGKLQTLLLGCVGFGLFVGLWWIATLGHSVSDPPSPPLTFTALLEIAASGELWSNTIASVFRVAWGFVLAAAVGIPFGIALGWYDPLRRAFNPLVQCLRPISPIAWMPVTVLVIGNGYVLNGDDESAIALIFLSSFFPIVTASNSAVNSIDRKFLRSSQNFGVGGLDMLRRVILPAAMPQILTGLRLALGISWVVVVAAEMIGVQHGLGFQVNIARQQLRYDHVGAAMVVIAVIGLLLDSFMARLERATLARRGMLSR